MISFTAEFKVQSIQYLYLNTSRIAQCLGLLSEAEVWQRPNVSSNSVGNLVLHLCGNIRQYIVSGLGKQSDARERDGEFAAAGGFTKAGLLQKLEATVQEAAEVIETVAEADLLTEHVVQGFNLTGIGIIVHVVEHYSYHTGQIAFWTKLLKDQDLAFYGDRDLNAKNEIV